MKVYIQKFIKSEADLPKDDKTYIVHHKQLGLEQTNNAGDKADKLFWLQWIDWYLLPVELPTEEDAMKRAKDNYRESNYAEHEINAFCDCMDWLLSRLK